MNKYFAFYSKFSYNVFLLNICENLKMTFVRLEKNKIISSDKTDAQLPSQDSVYLKLMDEARINMLRSIKLVGETEIAPRHPHLLDKFSNLYLSNKSGPTPNPNSPCFDDIWDNIKIAFDNILDGIGTEEEQRLAINNVVFTLIEAGVPFVQGKTICLWSTKLGFKAAESYSKLNNAIISRGAEEFIRKILVGWIDNPKLPVLKEFVCRPGKDKDNENNEPRYPQIFAQFWKATSEAYAASAEKGSIVHVFLQDALIIGNVFWLMELQAVRKNGCQVMLHQYDSKTHTWLPPVDIDSPQAMSLPLRRMAVHPLDGDIPSSSYITSGKNRFWKVQYNESKEDKLYNEIQHCSAPNLLTLGRLKEIGEKWMKKALDKQNAHAEVSLEQSSEETNHQWLCNRGSRAF